MRGYENIRTFIGLDGEAMEIRRDYRYQVTVQNGDIEEALCTMYTGVKAGIRVYP